MKQKHYNLKKSIILISLLMILIINCNSNSADPYTYSKPENISDGLETGTLEEVNINVKLIEKAVNKIYTGKFKEVHSMLIYKNNKLVLDEYFEGHRYKWDGPNHHGSLVKFNRDIWHQIHSDTKSITSICIGIAIDKGYINNVNQSIFDYLPDHQHLKTGEKENITIEHLLTMTSGLKWQEWNASYVSIENDVLKLWVESKDQVATVLERPLIHTPGMHFEYSGGNMIVLGEILKNASGMKIDEFSEKYIFQPLGIKSFKWANVFPSGIIDASAGLKLRPRAMTKIGITFLNHGIWNGKQIISEEWVKKSSINYAGNSGINIPGEASGWVGYSYTWWTKQYKKSGKKINMYYAGGWGGQFIMVFPELDMVVVFTGGNYVSYRPPFKIVKKYILPAVK